MKPLKLFRGKRFTAGRANCGALPILCQPTFAVPANLCEGSSRESKKDYLHFLHIARGSLSETQYFIHLSRRLGYLPEADAVQLLSQTKQTFACLHGLIKAVEKESGKFAKAIVVLTGLLVLSPWSRSLVVS